MALVATAIESVPPYGGSIAPVEGVTVIPSPVRVALLETTSEVPHFVPEARETVKEIVLELPAATVPLLCPSWIIEVPIPELVDGLKYRK